MEGRERGAAAAVGLGRQPSPGRVRQDLHRLLPHWAPRGVPMLQLAKVNLAAAAALRNGNAQRQTCAYDARRLSNEVQMRRGAGVFHEHRRAIKRIYCMLNRARQRREGNSAAASGASESCWCDRCTAVAESRIRHRLTLRSRWPFYGADAADVPLPGLLELSDFTILAPGEQRVGFSWCHAKYPRTQPQVEIPGLFFSVAWLVCAGPLSPEPAACFNHTCLRFPLVPRKIRRYPRALCVVLAWYHRMSVARGDDASTVSSQGLRSEHSCCVAH